MKLKQTFHYFLTVLCSSIFLSYSVNCYANTINIKQAMATGKTEWTSAFGLSVTQQEVAININISLLASDEVNRSKLANNISSWSEAINSVWNNRFFAQIDNSKLPVKIKVKFTHFKPHHRVVIHPGRWSPNQHNWYINSPALVIAHEIGHMLGAYDEYRGGALSPEQPIIDTTSIMGSKPLVGSAFPRHLAVPEKKLMVLLGNQQIKIISY